MRESQATFSSTTYPFPFERVETAAASTSTFFDTSVSQADLPDALLASFPSL